MADPAPPAPEKLADPSGPLTDLALTLPIFVGYHLGVVFLPVRNAADYVTRELQALANHSLLAYGGLTLAIGGLYAGLLLVAGRGHVLRWPRFLGIFVEGVTYAVAMRLVAGWVDAELFMAAGKALAGGAATGGVFAGLVMSLGAGFYEEVVFRVGLTGLGGRLLTLLFPFGPWQRRLVLVLWAIAIAFVFSAWHHVGELGDPFSARVFVFRWVCGLVFAAIYTFRGFAAAVWTHTLYDAWVLVF